jgi:hypothetical protein
MLSLRTYETMPPVPSMHSWHGANWAQGTPLSMAIDAGEDGLLDSQLMTWNKIRK